MEIWIEARREDRDKVEKVVASEEVFSSVEYIPPDSETQYAEHDDEPAPTMGMAAFMTTEPLNDADYGTSDQPMKKKPKLFETDFGKLERKPRLVKSEREQSSIKLAGKQFVPIEDSTQISKGKSLQLKPESTGEEEDKVVPKNDTRTQHLGITNKLGPIEALRLKIANDPAYAAELVARSRRRSNFNNSKPEVLAPEVLREREERRVQVRCVPGCAGEKGRIVVFRKDQEGHIQFLRTDDKGQNEWYRNDDHVRSEWFKKFLPLSSSSSSSSYYYW